MKIKHSWLLVGFSLASAVALLGCGSDDPAEVPFNGVKGTYLNTYMAGASETTAPPSEAVTVAALIPQPGGGYKTIDGSFHADGSFEIPGVPQGNYLLKIQSEGGAPIFYWTNERAIEVGYLYANRPDTAPVTITPTPLLFEVGGLSPWQETDTFELLSPGAGTFDFPYFELMPGDTSLGGASTDAYAMIQPNLIDGSKGDLLYVTQLVSRDAGGAPYTSLSKIFAPPAFSMQDGQPTTLTGSFSDVPQKTLSLDWKRTAFEALAKDVHPSAALFDSSFSMIAEYGGTSRITANIPPSLLSLYFADDGAPTTDFAGDLSYGNPFPSAWGLVVTASASFSVSVMLPGADAPKRLTGDVFCSTLMNDTASIIATPGLGPVKNILVNGESTADWRTGVGLTPTVSFSPPALGTAAGYRVMIRRIEPMVGGSRFVASLYTPETSIEIPEGILFEGNYYYIRVFTNETPINLTNRKALDEYVCGAAAFTHILEP